MGMSLKFKCSNCDEYITVKFLKIGETAICRSCGEENIVPETAVETYEESENHDIERHTSDEVPIQKESRLLKQIGGALFGILLGCIITNSIGTGAAYMFQAEEDSWLLTFWGSHHILRVLASLIGTLFGALAVGCIAKFRGALWGFISTLPICIFWMYIAFLAGSYELTFGHWFVVIVLMIVSPIAGLCGGFIGSSIRLATPDFFESRPGTILGIKWYHWLWLPFPIHCVGLSGTFSVYQGFYLFFRPEMFFLWNYFSILIYASILLMLVGLYKAFYLLSVGYKKELTGKQIALKVFLWITVTNIVVGMLQIITSFIMSPRGFIAYLRGIFGS